MAKIIKELSKVSSDNNPNNGSLGGSCYQRSKGRTWVPDHDS